MPSSKSMSFSFLTFNIWGLPFGFAADKRLRIKSIGKALSSANCDVICLQEVWVKDDYNTLKELLKESYPFHHYFYSGLTGSGLCVFSKWRIEETFYYQFPMNGLFHMIHHGDWFGGKGVGLAVINYNGLRVKIYNTHLHANYSNINENDPYHIHRLIQCFDTALFIKHSSGDADFCIFGGDLNSTPDDFCIQILQGLSNLEDTWELAKVRELIPETNDCKRNSYRQKWLPTDFQGLRIDYIFLKVQNNLKVDIKEWTFPFEEIIPGTCISYSDHEAVSVKCDLHFKSGDESSEKNVGSEDRRVVLKNNLLRSLEFCHKEINLLKNSIKTFFWFILFLLSVLLVLPFFSHEGIIIKMFLIIIALLICFQGVLIVTRWHDLAWLKNAKKRLKVYVTNLRNVPAQ